MAKKNSSDIVDAGAVLPRRQFLQAGLAGTALAATGVIGSASATGLGVPDWSRQLGASVDDAPYGKPSSYESTVIRRSVEWLTATRESSINFTPLYALKAL